MLRHYLSIAFRNQKKSKSISLISVLGLAAGMAVSILIFDYVAFEFSFDKQHSRKDRIFRVESQFYEGRVLTDDWATSSFGYGSAISREIPGVEEYVRIGMQNPEQTVSYREERSRESGIGYAGPSFFRVFDFRLIKGAVNDQLSRPRTVVITRSSAAKFFKNEEPLGKILTFARGQSFVDCEVTGVIEDFPENSHIKLNYIVSYESLPNYLKEFWYMHEAYTYLLLSPGTEPSKIEDAFPELSEKYKTRDAVKNKIWAIKLVPLEKIHLNPQKQYEKEVKGNRSSLITLIVIAILILITAWINYINLTTARSMERARDIGLNKVAGASQRNLVFQFLTESALIGISAFIIAMFSAFLLKPVFNNLTGLRAGMDILSSPLFLIASFAVLATGIFLSGAYPALVMTRIRPYDIIRTNFFVPGKAGRIRQALVVFQFAASIFLICGALTIFMQVKYLESQDRGVDIENTIVLKLPVSRENLFQKISLFGENLEKETFISSVSLTGAVPGMEIAFFASNRLGGQDGRQDRLYEMLTADEDFVRSFGFRLLAGRSFMKGFGNEREYLMVNESAMHLLNINKPEEAVGKKVLLEGESDPVTIIGVLENWHQRSAGNACTPVMVLLNGRLSWVPPRYLAIKTAGGDNTSIVNTMRERWITYFPEASFDYFFLDEFYDSQFRSERRFGFIVGIFTILSLFISLLGLWAMAEFSVSKRRKESGIRKVHGADEIDIFYHFSKEIVILILLSYIIAVPFSVITMKNWLSNFAIHAGLNWMIYIIAGVFTMALVVAIIALQSRKTIMANPVEAIHYE